MIAVKSGSAISGGIHLFRTSETGELSNKVMVFWMVIVSGLAVISASLYFGTRDRAVLSEQPFADKSFQARHPSNLTLGTSITPQAQANGLRAQGETVISDAEVMINALAVRLQTTPDDVEGWQMLGWSYFNTERYEQAASAYSRAVELHPDDADLHSIYGEALVRAADGFVTEQAADVFANTLALDPTDARARFFQGLVSSQKGDAAAAIEIWIEILDSTPAGAEWSDSLRQRILELAESSSIDVSGRVTASAASTAPVSGPSAEEMAAAATLSEVERQEMIVGMVNRLADRLEENPNDADGWIQLMRSRLVLGDIAAATQSFGRANTVFARDPETLSRLNTVAKELGLPVD